MEEELLTSGQMTTLLYMAEDCKRNFAFRLEEFFLVDSSDSWS